ncbi:MAG TPA: DoxX family membrane protein, partial [Turneriella sp.]|nr:DoxX family membrane protein [Turneriella sp.]
MTQLIQTIAATQAEWTGLVLRLALAAMILPHGAQKLLGWFGGYGFKGTMGYFTGTAGLPAILAFLVIIGEFFGGL